MATQSILNPTMADAAKMSDEKGMTPKVVELLTQVNPILYDMTMLPSNMTNSHKTTTRTGFADATWYKAYKYIQPSKGTVVEVVDTIGDLQSYSEIDASIVDMQKDKNSFRMIEDTAHLEGMNNEVSANIFYGNESVDAEKFTGLAPRFNSLSAESGDNIIDAGGSGSDNTSMWLICWDQTTCHGIYPMNTKAGFHMRDEGVITKRTTDGNLRLYASHYQWKVGLVVRDWRYVVRIANIDVSQLNTVANTKNLVTWMIEACERIPTMGRGRLSFYCNYKIRTKLRLGILEKAVNQLTYETVAGRRVAMFDGVPLNRSDAILSTESAIT